MTEHELTSTCCFTLRPMGIPYLVHIRHQGIDRMKLVEIWEKLPRETFAEIHKSYIILIRLKDI